jgi:hypothetical protein
MAPNRGVDCLGYIKRRIALSIPWVSIVFELSSPLTNGTGFGYESSFEAQVEPYASTANNSHGHSGNSKKYTLDTFIKLDSGFNHVTLIRF